MSKSISALKVLALVSLFLLASAGLPSTAGAQLRPVRLAPGFEFNVFADQRSVPEFDLSLFSGPTAMAFDSRGRLFVSTYSGKILILLDEDDNGVVDEIKTFAQGIPLPLGIEFLADGDLFVTSNVVFGSGSILRLRDFDGDDVVDEVTVVVDGLPSHGDHHTNRLKFGPDGLLYFGQGSATDKGTPKPGFPAEGPLNATVLRLDINDPEVEVFATGLRNPFGMAFHPVFNELFTTDGGSGELCQFGDCPPGPSPPDEINWVRKGLYYGFPICEGVPILGDADCIDVTTPVAIYPPHLTPTSIAFYTGPQAGEYENDLLLTLYKRVFGIGGDLRRLSLEGDPENGFHLFDMGFIAEFGVIDPFDGPLDIAIDPIRGDIYVARFDPVPHRDPKEHHHIIYRIRRSGTDALPFIGSPKPSRVEAGSGPLSIHLVGRRLREGAVVLADSQQVPTRAGDTRFDLIADLPGSLTAGPGAITIEVLNPDGTRSNARTLFVVEPGGGDGGGGGGGGGGQEPDSNPQLTNIRVTRNQKNKPVSVVTVGVKFKKFRLVAEGSNFQPGAVILVNGSPLRMTDVGQGPNQLIGRFTEDMVARPQELDIQVRNPDGRVSTTLTLQVVAQ